VLTQGIQFPFTVEAIPARDREWNHHPITHGQIAYAWADFHHFAHELVAENVAPIHRRHVAVVKVQVRAANRRRRHLHDRIARIEDVRIWHILHADLSDSLPTYCLHCRRLPSVTRPSTLRRPAGCPMVVATSPVSMSCLRRRKSPSICA